MLAQVRVLLPQQQGFGYRLDYFCKLLNHDIQEFILPSFRIVLSGDDDMYGKPVAVKQVRPMTHVHPVFPAIGQITSMQWASTVHGRPLHSLVTSVCISGVLGY